jgi:hypothetical protein
LVSYATSKIEIAPSTEDVIGFLALEISVDIKRLNLPYFIPKTALVKPPENESGYLPDILVINRSILFGILS